MYLMHFDTQVSQKSVFHQSRGTYYLLWHINSPKRRVEQWRGGSEAAGEAA